VFVFLVRGSILTFVFDVKLSFIAGITLLIGPNKVVQYFMNKSRLQATVITAIGMAY
jgi:hypothetical protein